MKLSAASARTRLAVWFVGFLTAACLYLLLVAPLPSALAQPDAPPGDQPPPTAAPAKPAPPASAVVTMLTWFGYLMYVVLVIVSITLVALIVLLAMDLRMSGCIPPGFIEDFTDTVNKRQFKQAYEMAKNDGSFLGRVMTTGMSRLQYGIEDARQAAFNMVESIRASKDQLIAYLAAVGTLGPLLGLVGTVSSMIKAFSALSTSQPRFEDLAKHISEALVLTLIGIGLSVPAIFTHTFFRNRLTRISNDAANIADDLLTQMYHNSKKPAPAGGAEPVAVADNRAVPSAAVKPK